MSDNSINYAPSAPDGLHFASLRFAARLNSGVMFQRDQHEQTSITNLPI